MECRALGCLLCDHTMIFCVQRALHTIYLSRFGLSLFSRFVFLLSALMVCGVVTVFEECEEGWIEKGMAD